MLGVSSLGEEYSYSTLVEQYKRDIELRASIRNLHHSSSERIEFQIRDWYR